MSRPLLVSLPHRLGKQEAALRLKAGLGNARSNYGQLLTIEEETWSGDSVQFRVRALGQIAHGKIDILDDHVLLEVTLPWLLAKFAEKLAPAIRKEGVLMLEKK
jgi:Putative polyhydroxyalkanoic acid system protein (PHA_gran_rgn)